MFIGDCHHRGWGRHDCIHREDVAVSCYNATEAGMMVHSVFTLLLGSSVGHFDWLFDFFTNTTRKYLGAEQEFKLALQTAIAGPLAPKTDASKQSEIVSIYKYMRIYCCIYVI